MKLRVLLAAVLGLTLSSVWARADFVFLHNRTTITSGMFAGDDVVELDVKNDGTHGTGTTLLAATVVLESFDPTGKTFPGQFFIRAYDSDGTGRHNGGDPSSNPTDNDMDVSGIGGESPLGTYVRFGNPTQWTFGSHPTFVSSDDANYVGNPKDATYPASGKYSDGQALAGPLQIIGAANLTGGGITDTSAMPLAFAVVPRFQPVRFDVNIAGSVGPSYTGPAIDDPFPEPASLGLLSVAGITVAVRRPGTSRRKRHNSNQTAGELK